MIFSSHKFKYVSFCLRNRTDDTISRLASRDAVKLFESFSLADALVAGFKVAVLVATLKGTPFDDARRVVCKCVRLTYLVLT